MKELSGNLSGLSSGQIKKIQKLYDSKSGPEFLISQPALERLVSLSHEIRRQIGALMNRDGKIEVIMVGDAHQIFIPETPDYKAVPGRLKGLRCIHTHLDDSPLSRDDLTDLALLRLDMMVSVSVKADGRPGFIYAASIKSDPSSQPPYDVSPPMTQSGLDMDARKYIFDLEADIAKTGSLYEARADQEKAILVSVSSEKKDYAQAGLNELYELAVSNDIFVIDTILQQKSKPDPKFLMGKGKLSDVSILAMQKSATMIVFDQELTPAQVRSITDYIDLKVIDRTQLILDIFSQRAKSREGKLQVELAQMKYLLPRLATKNTAMSRLTGGIGGRGPGETKLEINRRRARESIEKLTKDLKLVRKHREQQRARRNRMGLPVFSIVGYTNAGKSTLLNSLTQSEIYAKDQLFATLDPSSRKLRFPQEIEAIITDTVGFIRDLPKELMAAFSATLEELESADVLIHVIDISNPSYMEQIESVEKILNQLKLDEIPVIPVLNKMDLLDEETVEIMAAKLKGIPVCARDRKTLAPLFDKMAEYAVLKLHGMPENTEDRENQEDQEDQTREE